MAAVFVAIQRRKRKAAKEAEDQESAEQGEELDARLDTYAEEPEKEETLVIEEEPRPDPADPRFHLKKPDGRPPDSFDDALRDYINDQDYPGEKAEAPIGFLMTLLMIAFLLSIFSNCGIYAFLDRNDSAGESVARAQQIMFGDYDVRDLVTFAEITAWMSSTFLPNFYSFNSYQPACTAEALTAMPYAYGALSNVPTFTVRSLGDERTWGCESPYFNFEDDVEIGGFNLHKYSYCTDKNVNLFNGSIDSDGNVADHGGFIFGTAWGFACEETPSVPSIIHSGCTAEDNICNSSKTFCEAFLLKSRCTNEKRGCGLKGSSWEDMVAADNPVLHGKTVNENLVAQGGLNQWGSQLGFGFSSSSFFAASDGPQAVTSVGPYWGTFGKYLNDSGPYMYLDPDKTCTKSWEEHGAIWIENTVNFVYQAILEGYNSVTSRGIIFTVYLPLADGAVVEQTIVFTYEKDGGVSNIYNSHVKPINDQIDRRSTNMLLAQGVCLMLYSLWAGIHMLSHLLCYAGWAFTCCQPLKLYQKDAKGRPVPTTISWCICFVIIGVVIYVCLEQFIRINILVDEDGNTYAKEDGKPANKFRSMMTTCAAYFVCDIGLKVLQVVELELVYKTGCTLWHHATMAYDGVVCIVALVGIVTVVTSAEEVGGKIGRLAEVAPPWNGWMEEAIFHEMKTDPRVSIFVGIGLLLAVLRLLKYLSIFPMLGVPVSSIFNSLKELTFFLVVLVLFSYAFTLLFMFGFGGTMEYFSGLSITFSQVFESAINGDVSSDVYTQLDTIGDSSWDVTYGRIMIFIFRLVIALMFMNMLISIIMGHYGYLRALPENKDLVNKRDVDNAKEAYELAKRHMKNAHHATTKKMYDMMKAKMAQVAEKKKNEDGSGTGPPESMSQRVSKHLMFFGRSSSTGGEQEKFEAIEMTSEADNDKPLINFGGAADNFFKVLGLQDEDESPHLDDVGDSCLPGRGYQEESKIEREDEAEAEEEAKVEETADVNFDNEAFAKLVERIDAIQGVVDSVLKNQKDMQETLNTVNENMLEYLTEGTRPK